MLLDLMPETRDSQISPNQAMNSLTLGLTLDYFVIKFSNYKKDYRDVIKFSNYKKDYGNVLNFSNYKKD